VGLIEEVALHLAEVLVGIDGCPYEALDSTVMPVRDAKRRGAGWLAGYADIGWSNRLGWYEGFRLLVAARPTGVITGFGFGAASTADQPMAETFFTAREHPSPRLASVGSTTSGYYVADKGFEGSENHRRWLERYGALLVHPPKRNSRKRSWLKRLRRWVAAGLRQIVESVYDKLLNTFGLHRERPHQLSGLRARLAARLALHNFCIRLNDQLGRTLLAFADLLGGNPKTHTKRLRLSLVKIGGRVRQLFTKVRLHLASGHPDQRLRHTLSSVDGKHARE
jgi:hypothetical protein